MFGSDGSLDTSHKVPGTYMLIGTFAELLGQRGFCTLGSTFVFHARVVGFLSTFAVATSLSGMLLKLLLSFKSSLSRKQIDGFKLAC